MRWLVTAGAESVNVGEETLRRLLARCDRELKDGGRVDPVDLWRATLIGRVYQDPAEGVFDDVERVCVAGLAAGAMLTMGVVPIRGAS